MVAMISDVLMEQHTAVASYKVVDLSVSWKCLFDCRLKSTVLSRSRLAHNESFHTLNKVFCRILAYRTNGYD